MKIGIISDIHGNYPALETVLRELKTKGCTKVVCLGDVCGYYSMVNECIDLLRRENVCTLKGNHDSYLLGEGVCPRSNSVNRCIEYQRGIITKRNMKWLSELRSFYKCKEFEAVHGGWTDPLDEYIDVFDFSLAKENNPNVTNFFSGHTHIQLLQKEIDGSRSYCNPGAVGQPRDGNPKAAYAIIEEDRISLGRVEYNIDLIAENMKVAGFSDYFFRNLYVGRKIGDA